MSPQGLFETAAKTYRSRASVAASIDFDWDDGPAAVEDSVWQTADDGDALQLSSTEARGQLRQGKLLEGFASLQSSLQDTRVNLTQAPPFDILRSVDGIQSVG